MTIAVENVIREITGIVGDAAAGTATVWVYGEVGWVHGDRFEFENVTVTTSLCSRFRDGESAMFLVEMPSAVAGVLGLEQFVVEGDRLETLRSRCTKY